MMFNKEQYDKVVNVPLAVIFASAIIILLTTGVNDENALRGLIGGYMGLGLGLLFLIILNMPPTNLIDLFPFIMLIGIITLMMIYLYKYFDRIAKGEVSSYYNSFSILSTIFLAVQFSMLASAMSNKSVEINGKLLTDRAFSLFALFGVINYLIVITIGIILNFYSTQG
jgi:hypothetical protein